jgi:hypothetical protein
VEARPYAAHPVVCRGILRWIVAASRYNANMTRMVVVLAALAGCMPSYTYERPALPDPSPSQEATCYRAKRYSLLVGDAEWTTQRSSGNYVITETFGSSGVSFRRGGELVPARDAIASLGDPDLVAGYRHLLDETSGAHARYPLYRDVAFGLAFGGLAMVTGALVIALQDTSSSAITPLAFGGAGVAVLSLIPAILASRTYNPAVQHDLDDHMFRQTEWADRTAAAAFAYNQKVATECGLGTADLPMTPEAAKYFHRQ